MTAELKQRIADLSQEVMEKAKELNALKLELSPEPVAKDYAFQTRDGEVRLSELFGEHRDLILVHNMGSKCPYCTLWADGFNGLLHHIESRAAYAVVSPDDPATQQAFAEGRGWRYRMLSNGDSGFTRDMGFQSEQDGKTWYMPGYSTFRKQDDGSVVRVAFDHFGPGDVYCGVWHMFALLDGGAGEWGPRLSYD